MNKHQMWLGTVTTASILGLAAVPAGAGLTFFDFTLDGGQEAPANDSDAFGLATLTYDDSAQTFDLSLFTDGIAFDTLLGVGPNATPIHLHLAPPGANGGIVIDLGLVGAFTDEGGGILSFDVMDVPIGGDQGAVPATDPAANEAALFAGNLYLNVHTSDYPSGNIRGQVVPAPGAAALLALSTACLCTRRRRHTTGSLTA